MVKIDASISAIASDPSRQSPPITIPIHPPSTKTHRDRPNRRRLEITPVLILFVLVNLLDPAPAPEFYLDAGSDRTISADAVVFAAEAEEAEGQHIGTTKPIPSYSLYQY